MNEKNVCKHGNTTKWLIKLSALLCKLTTCPRTSQHVCIIEHRLRGNCSVYHWGTQYCEQFAISQTDRSTNYSNKGEVLVFIFFYLSCFIHVHQIHRIIGIVSYVLCKYTTYPLRHILFVCVINCYRIIKKVFVERKFRTEYKPSKYDKE